MEQIELGQSGATLEVLDSETGKVVLKSASRAGARRLRAQAQLQEAFFRNRADLQVNTPEILNLSDCSFMMTWIDGETLGEFLINASLFEAAEAVGRLAGWLRSNVVRSSPQDNSATLSNKLWDVWANTRYASFPFRDPEGFAKRVAAGLQAGADFGRQGYVHGDLSFDNILVERHSLQLVLIDFLDLVADDPILDVARLYLDARFAWWASHGRPRNRLLLAGHLLANELEEIVEESGAPANYFRACLALTILRILPYTRGPVRRGLLMDALARCFPQELRIGAI